MVTMLDSRTGQRPIVPSSPLGEGEAELVHEYLAAGATVWFPRDQADGASLSDASGWLDGWTSVGVVLEDGGTPSPSTSPDGTYPPVPLPPTFSRSVEMTFRPTPALLRVMFGLSPRAARRRLPVTRSARLARRARRRDLARMAREARRG